MAKITTSEYECVTAQVSTERFEGQQTSNNNKQAEYNARSNNLWLEPWRQTDPRVLLGLGFKLLGENAARIGNLTITPALLTSILDAKN